MTIRFSFMIGFTVWLIVFALLLLYYEVSDQTFVVIFDLVNYFLYAALIIGCGIFVIVFSETILELNPKWRAAIDQRDIRWKYTLYLERGEKPLKTFEEIRNFMENQG